jgi:hypothetical protein
LSFLLGKDLTESAKKNLPLAQANIATGIHRKGPNIYRSLEQRNCPAWILVINYSWRNKYLETHTTKNRTVNNESTRWAILKQGPEMKLISPVDRHANLFRSARSLIWTILFIPTSSRIYQNLMEIICDLISTDCKWFFSRTFEGKLPLQYPDRVSFNIKREWVLRRKLDPNPKMKNSLSSFFFPKKKKKPFFFISKNVFLFMSK